MKHRFGYNKIYVIESLQACEFKTGKNIYEDLIKRKVYNNPILYHEYVDIKKYKEFESLMLRINGEIKSGILPFIHFEIHGSSQKDGLVLSSGELVSWQQLAYFTRNINKSTHNNLAISFASCHAAHFMNSIKLDDAAPFSCFVSTIEAVTTGEVEIDFTNFFDTFFSSADFGNAVSALNRDNKNPHKYNLFSAEDFFEKAFAKIIDEDYNPNHYNYKHRVNMLTKEFLATNPNNGNQRKKDIKKMLREYLQNEKATIRQQYREKFLPHN